MPQIVVIGHHSANFTQDHRKGFYSEVVGLDTHCFSNSNLAITEVWAFVSKSGRSCQADLTKAKFQAIDFLIIALSVYSVSFSICLRSVEADLDHTSRVSQVSPHRSWNSFHQFVSRYIIYLSIIHFMKPIRYDPNNPVAEPFRFVV